MDTKKYQKRLRNYPPAAIWTNCNTGRLLLEKHGIKATTMYRPNKLSIPEKCLPMPKERRILWYWAKDDVFFKELEEQYIAIAKQLEDVEIWVIPRGDTFCDLPNVKAVKPARMASFLPKVYGMVRLSHYPDYGRSMFNVLAYGRWVWTMGMNEPYITAAPLSELADNIRFRLDSDGRNDAGHKWIQDNCAEKALHKKWVNEAKGAIGC